MIIIGAKGHAVEVFQCLKQNDHHNLAFYDDINLEESLVFDKYPIYQDLKEVEKHFLIDRRYILGLGGSSLRRKLVEKFNALGGLLTSSIAETAVVSSNSRYGEGLNIMHFSLVAANASIGNGTLINAGAAIHHDVTVGEYCEISPGARLLGRCFIGNNVLIGAGAIILPDIHVGNEVIIGAGAVVTRDVQSNTKVVGVPARLL